MRTIARRLGIFGVLWLGAAVSAPAAVLRIPVAQTAAPYAVPAVVDAATALNRGLLEAPDLADGLKRLQVLASQANSGTPQAADSGHAAALLLGLLTSPDLHALAIESAPHRGLLSAMPPADAQTLRLTSARLRERAESDPALVKRLESIARQLKHLMESGSLDAVSAQLSQVADNEALLETKDVSPIFAGAPVDRVRTRLAALHLPKDPARVARALKGVELPAILAYKAATIGLRDDLQGVVSEIGAAQKISGNLYKIRGQTALAASLSPYSREASDQRYTRPKEHPASEDYTSRARLKQQLATEYANLETSPGRAKFALASTARTAWGDGHAWLGLRAQLAPGQEPVDVQLHVRLLGERTRNQKGILGAIGVNALFGAYYHLNGLSEFVRGLGDGLPRADFEIDFLSIVWPGGEERAGRAGADELLRLGLARRILLAPGGAPVAPVEAAADRPAARWILMEDGKRIGTAASETASAAPPQDEPLLVEVKNPVFASPAGGNWTLLTSEPARAADEFPRMLHPAARGANAFVPPASLVPHSRTDAKAKRLNGQGWINGAFADIGGYQSVATRFFEASNTHSIFDTVSFPNAASARSRYGEQGANSDADYLRKQVDFEFARVAASAPQRRFALVVRADENVGGAYGGSIALKLEDAPGGAVSESAVSFRFEGGTWQQRRNALATLGVNLLYAARYETQPEGAFLSGLAEDISAPVRATIKLVSVSGPMAKRLGRAP